MKKLLIILLVSIFTLVSADAVVAQCSICSKTAQQMGEKPAKGLNAGIIYLMATPYAVIGFIGYRLWKQNQKPKSEE